MFNIIYGKSGSGKSTSLRNFGPNDIVLLMWKARHCHSAHNSHVRARRTTLTP